MEAGDTVNKDVLLENCVLFCKLVIELTIIIILDFVKFLNVLFTCFHYVGLFRVQLSLPELLNINLIICLLTRYLFMHALFPLAVAVTRMVILF